MVDRKACLMDFLKADPMDLSILKEMNWELDLNRLDHFQLEFSKGGQKGVKIPKEINWESQKVDRKAGLKDFSMDGRKAGLMDS